MEEIGSFKVVKSGKKLTVLHQLWQFFLKLHKTNFLAKYKGTLAGIGAFGFLDMHATTVIPAYRFHLND